MRTVLVIALLALCGLASAQIETRWFNTRLDHFNVLNRRTFDLRYTANREVYISGGPLFIYITGEFDLYDTFVEAGAVYEIAADLNGYVFGLEHRYFGQSRPTEDTSVENLQWLNVHQAVADIAAFISFLKENYYEAQNSRIILWGRGYGGSLAAWARQKYPNLVDGVWASSAPINAVLQNPSFMRNAFYTMWSIGDVPCGTIMENAFRIIEEAIRTDNTTWVSERLNLCSPINTQSDLEITSLLYGLAQDIGYLFVTHASYPDIDNKCRIMQGLDDPENPAENDLDAFARWFVDDFSSDRECLDYNHLPFYQNVSWDSISTTNGRRQKLWLRCTQIGQFPVANEGEGHPFGWRFDVDFFEHWCAQAFDPEL